MVIVNSSAEDTCEKNHQHDAIPHRSPQHDGIEPGTLEAKSNRDAEKNSSSSESNSDLNDDAQSTNASEVSYPEGGLEAWLVVFGSFCAMGVVFGLINSSAVFEAYFKENQLKEYSHSQIGWIFSLNLFLVFFVGIQIGPIFDRHGPRALIVAGSVLCVLSLMLLSLSTQYYQIILTYSVMGGIGGALLNCPAYSAIAHFFNHRRGLATGLATTAGGVGGIIFPLLLQFLLGENGVGFAWSCRIMGFILLGLCVFANLFIRSRREVIQAQSQDGGSVWPDFKILRNRGFAMAAAGIFFMEYGLFVPLTYIISYARSHGYGDTDSSVLLSLLNAGSVVGRALPGLLADKLGRFNVIIMTISLCATTILALWIPAGDSKAILTVFCVLFGFASGSNLSLVPVCLGQFCDLKDYGRYYSTATMIASFGTLSSVPIGGALLGVGDLNTGWLALILFSGVAYVAALSCYTYARVSVTGWKLKAKF